MVQHLKHGTTGVLVPQISMNTLNGIPGVINLHST